MKEINIGEKKQEVDVALKEKAGSETSRSGKISSGRSSSDSGSSSSSNESDTSEKMKNGGDVKGLGDRQLSNEDKKGLNNGKSSDEEENT